MSTEPQPTQTQGPAPQLDRPPQPDTAPPQQAGPEPLPHHTIKHTRISGLWFAVVLFAVLLLFLLIFILQNEQKVDIAYLGAHEHLQLGVALLLSAVCGVLLTILAGAARMAQLHSVARRHRRADARHRAASAAGTPADPGR